MKLWDVAAGELKDTLVGHANGVNWVTFSLDGKTLASGSADATVRLWRARPPQQRNILHGHEEAVR